MLGSDIAEDEWLDVGGSLPRIDTAKALDARKVLIKWRGESDPAIVDVAPALASLRIFSRLRSDDGLFRQVRVNEDGNALEWPDGAELSAIWIDRLHHGDLTNDEFRQAMAKMNVSLDGMAGHLGISRRLVAAYRKDKIIPRHVALATRYLLKQRGLGL